MTPEEAMDRRDALIDRLLEMTGPAARDVIHDLLLAESDLTHALMERGRARAVMTEV
jgi:hypothetical protein